jgi:hypothetical protein
MRTNNSVGKRVSGLAFLFVVLAPLLLSVVVLLFVIPFAACPECLGTGTHVPDCDDGIGRTPCKPCSKRGKLSYFKKWINENKRTP